MLPERIARRPKQPYRAPGLEAFIASDGRLVPEAEALLAAPPDPIEPAAAKMLVEKLLRQPERVAPREEQAFLLLLSTCALDRLFIRREGLSRVGPRPPMGPVVDLSLSDGARL